jgi:uncharacterized protein
MRAFHHIIWSRMNFLKIVAFAMAGFAPITHAASFNCSKAASQKELLICTDIALSKLDDELGVSFARATTRLGDKNLVRAWQRDWLRSNEVSGCNQSECLQQLWSTRILKLESAIASPWNGLYDRYYGTKVDKNTAELMLLTLAEGDVEVTGNAVSIRSISSSGEPNVNIGEIGAVTKPVGKKLAFESDGCEVKLTIDGKRVLVQDNYRCGGMGVTFSGEYRKR